MKNYTFSLERYGVGKRHTCPACGRPKCFTLYVDADGAPLSGDVGRCDHESSCGYHKTPAEHFREHPGERGKAPAAPASPRTERRPDYIDLATIHGMEGTGNSLMDYLRGFFPSEDIERVTREYHLGSTEKREVVYPQIGINGMCRTAKIMRYGKDGHRIKDGSGGAPVDWLHARMMRGRGRPVGDFALKQCLFGEHILTRRPEAVVCLVEAEKTAVICAMRYPRFVWLACGGINGLGKERCRALAGRTVLLFPDADAYPKWREKAGELGFCRSVEVSDWAAEEPEGSSCDIADKILDEILEETGPKAGGQTIGELCALMKECGLPKGRIVFNV